MCYSEKNGSNSDSNNIAHVSNFASSIVRMYVRSPAASSICSGQHNTWVKFMHEGILLNYPRLVIYENNVFFPAGK